MHLHLCGNPIIYQVYSERKKEGFYYICICDVVSEALPLKPLSVIVQQ